MSPTAVLTFCNEFCTLETSRPTPAWSQCRYSARLQCAALPGCLSGWPGSDDQLAHPGETAREGRLGRVLLREGGSSSSSRSSTRVCCRHIGVSEASVEAAERVAGFGLRGGGKATARRQPAAASPRARTATGSALNGRLRSIRMRHRLAVEQAIIARPAYQILASRALLHARLNS